MTFALVKGPRPSGTNTYLRWILSIFSSAHAGNSVEFYGRSVQLAVRPTIEQIISRSLLGSERILPEQCLWERTTRE